MMRVYYDNVITSGLVTGDISPESEREALAEIEVAHEAGFVKRVTSRESWREQERTRDASRRAQLQSARDLVSVVQADHRVLGFATLNGPLGTVATNPLVSNIVDEALFAKLKAVGLKDADARHFMYAAANGCARFITLDRDFLDRRDTLEDLCPSLRVARPSDLATELRGVTRGRR